LGSRKLIRPGTKLTNGHWFGGVSFEEFHLVITGTLKAPAMQQPRGLSMFTRPGYLAHMLWRPRNLPAGFIQPCLPTKAQQPPSGGLWLHEIKHDGFRVIARKDGRRVRLYSI
jgi:hypothetical protein